MYCKLETPGMWASCPVMDKLIFVHLNMITFASDYSYV